MHIISLVGFKGSGKDTVASYLIDYHGYQGISFADSLKDALCVIFGWDRDMIEGATHESREWRETVDQWWAAKLNIPHFTPRWAMQNIGTDLFRNHFNQDLWVHSVENKLRKMPADAKVVLIDGRFPNELDLGRKYGAVVARVKRGDEPEWFDKALRVNQGIGSQNDETELHSAAHVSEWAWIGYDLDAVIINDGTVSDLCVKAKDILIG